MRCLLIATLLPLFACAKEPETGFAVEEGAYTVVFLTEWDQGDCSFDTIHFNPDPAATTISASETEMQVSFDEGDKILDCSRDVDDFSCAPVPFFDQSLSGNGKDAVVTTTFAMEGSWESETAFSGSYTHGFSCAGEDCDDLSGTAYGADASFPCTLGGELEGALD